MADLSFMETMLNEFLLSLRTEFPVVSERPCLSYFSHSCQKISEKKQYTKGWVNFGSVWWSSLPVMGTGHRNRRRLATPDPQSEAQKSILALNYHSSLAFVVQGGSWPVGYHELSGYVFPSQSNHSEYIVYKIEIKNRTFTNNKSLF